MNLNASITSKDILNALNGAVSGFETGFHGHKILGAEVDEFHFCPTSFSKSELLDEEKEKIETQFNSLGVKYRIVKSDIFVKKF